MSLRLALLLLISLTAWAQAPNALTPQEKAAGWVLLFDGNTPAGWLEITGKPFPATWTVDDGWLRAIPGHGLQDIRTVEDFRNFELRFDWKIASGGNSGVKYLVQRVDEWNRDGRQARARGFEYQLTDDAASEEARRDASRGTASLYSALAPQKLQAHPAGDVNHSAILVRGDHIEHWLNGERVLEFDLSQAGGLLPGLTRGAPLHRDGPIALQNHNSEVWFRNLKVRRLD